MNHDQRTTSVRALWEMVLSQPANDFVNTAALIKTRYGTSDDFMCGFAVGATAGKSCFCQISLQLSEQFNFPCDPLQPQVVC